MNLPGAPAFRDFGGHPTASGRVKRGALYRSEVLAGLDAQDRARIEALGVQLVCDLRSTRERERVACLDWLQPPPRRMHCDVNAALRPAARTALERLQGLDGGNAAREVMLHTYDSMPLASAAHLRDLLPRLAAGELPAIIHCSAGKDRTGFFCAIVLSALGVAREDVYADYLFESAGLRRARRARTTALLEALLGSPVSGQAVEVFSGVERTYLDAAFAAVDREFGGIEAYLREALGFDAALRDALLGRLVERA
jgi:protein-tyrosine phosphatase